MSDSLRELFRGLPDLFAGHLLLSAGALWIGVLLSVLLSCSSNRVPGTRQAVRQLVDQLPAAVAGGLTECMRHP